MRRLAVVLASALCLATSLACSGIVDGAIDAAENNPEFKKEFEKSFRESFAKACADKVKGAKAKRAEKVCTCAADELLATNDLKELMEMVGDLENPANKEKLAGVMEKCGK